MMMRVQHLGGSRVNAGISCTQCHQALGRLVKDPLTVVEGPGLVFQLTGRLISRFLCYEAFETGLSLRAGNGRFRGERKHQHTLFSKEKLEQSAIPPKILTFNHTHGGTLNKDTTECKKKKKKIPTWARTDHNKGFNAKLT